MTIEFALTCGPYNTKYAPLAALGWYYQQDGTLKSFEKVVADSGKADFSLATKLEQVLSSILAGCQYICEVNNCLSSEHELARAWAVGRYLEQSSLALGLNQLSRTNLEQLEQVSRWIWARHSQALGHDWRGLLRVEMDLSGLPSGKQAEGSEKGYFGVKKHHWAAVGPGECHAISGNAVVLALPGVTSQRMLPPRRAAGG